MKEKERNLRPQIKLLCDLYINALSRKAPTLKKKDHIPHNTFCVTKFNNTI
jgi:hypothetical protein